MFYMTIFACFATLPCTCQSSPSNCPLVVWCKILKRISWSYLFPLSRHKITRSADCVLGWNVPRLIIIMMDDNDNNNNCVVLFSFYSSKRYQVFLFSFFFSVRGLLASKTDGTSCCCVYLFLVQVRAYMLAHFVILAGHF